MSLDRWCYPRGLIDPPVAVEFAGAPLRLYERGVWIPGDEYWGEPGDVVPVPVVEVIAGGARRGYEFEQLLPGGDDPDPRDVIGEALALRDGGQHERAEAVLRGVAAWDPRCLDAHAHLGLLAFDAGDVEAALAHYAAGVWVAEQSLPDLFDGVLSWGWVDNRPFLRCVHGLDDQRMASRRPRAGRGALLGAVVAESGRSSRRERRAREADCRRALAFMIGALGPRGWWSWRWRHV